MLTDDLKTVLRFLRIGNVIQTYFAGIQRHLQQLKHGQGFKLIRRRRVVFFLWNELLLFLLVGVEKTSLQPVFRDEFEVFLKSYGARETGERGR